MKIFLILLLSFVLVCGVAAQRPHIGSSQHPAPDASLMKPGHPAYEEAMEFSTFLKEKGIKVLSLHRSKLEGMFPGLTKAAFFKTEKGVVEVIFFPEPGAENVIVTEKRTGGRYLYSFSGHPTLVGGFDSKQPMYFLMHRNWFIVPAREELYQELKTALHGSLAS
jgi:hypothetical protein